VQSQSRQLKNEGENFFPRFAWSDGQYMIAVIGQLGHNVIGNCGNQMLNMGNRCIDSSASSFNNSGPTLTPLSVQSVFPWQNSVAHAIQNSTFAIGLHCRAGDVIITIYLVTLPLPPVMRGASLQLHKTYDSMVLLWFSSTFSREGSTRPLSCSYTAVQVATVHVYCNMQQTQRSL